MNPIDLIIIGAYLIGCVVAGVWFSGKQSGAADYFVAGGSMRGWFNSLLVGLSIAATLFSGLSFIMLPSVIYGGGTVFVLSVASFPLAWVVLRYWFLPRYLSGPAGQQPYDIVERQFGGIVRSGAASMFLLLRVGWMAALIYAPTVALMGAWQLDDAWFWPLVLIIGLTSTIYTTMGGIRGVIFTDALQFVVIAIGIIYVVAYVLINMPGTSAQAVQSLVDDGFFASFDLSLSGRTLTVWAVCAGAIVGNLGSYIGDQMSLQRYLASGDVKESSRAFAVNVVGVSVVFLLLVTVGMALRVWYLQVPDASLPTNADQVFPYFIATQLPVGVTGLLIAAILAATMSSMTSGINTIAAVITLDFRMRMGSLAKLDNQQQLRFSRAASLIVGVLATGFAGLVGGLGTVFDIAQTLLGAFTGPLFACLLLSTMRWRFSPMAMLSGMVLGSAAGWVVAWSPLVSLWVGPTSFATAVLWTVLGSCIFKPDRLSCATSSEA